jgi:hypothetical protein
VVTALFLVHGVAATAFLDRQFDQREQHNVLVEARLKFFPREGMAGGKGETHFLHFEKAEKAAEAEKRALSKPDADNKPAARKAVLAKYDGLPWESKLVGKAKPMNAGALAYKAKELAFFRKRKQDKVDKAAAAFKHQAALANAAAAVKRQAALDKAAAAVKRQAALDNAWKAAAAVKRQAALDKAAAAAKRQAALDKAAAADAEKRALRKQEARKAAWCLTAGAALSKQFNCSFDKQATVQTAARKAVLVKYEGLPRVSKLVGKAKPTFVGGDTNQRQAALEKAWKAAGAEKRALNKQAASNKQTAVQTAARKAVLTKYEGLPWVSKLVGKAKPTFVGEERKQPMNAGAIAYKAKELAFFRKRKQDKVDKAAAAFKRQTALANAAAAVKHHAALDKAAAAVKRQAALDKAWKAAAAEKRKSNLAKESDAWADDLQNKVRSLESQALHRRPLLWGGRGTGVGARVVLEPAAP